MNDDVSVPATNADNTAPQPAAPAQTTAPADWRASLPDDLKANPSLGKFSDPAALAGSYVNLERMLGFEKVPRPKGDFDPGNPDWKMYLKASGHPETADEYKFNEVKLPDGMTYDKGMEAWFKPVAHAAGLNGKQAQMMHDAYVAMMGQAYSSQQTEINNDTEARREALKQELGSAYEGWSKAASVAQDEFFTPALLDKIKAAGLDRDPEWTRVLGKIGRDMIGDDKLKTGEQQMMQTPDEQMAAIREYQNKYGYAIYDVSHPEHAAKSQELNRMFDRLHPGFMSFS